MGVSIRNTSFLFLLGEKSRVVKANRLVCVMYWSTHYFMKRSGTTTKILRIAYMTCALGGPNARLAHIFSLYLAQFLKHRIMSNFFFFERNLLLVVHYFYRFIVLSFYRMCQEDETLRYSWRIGILLTVLRYFATIRFSVFNCRWQARQKSDEFARGVSLD